MFDSLSSRLEGVIKKIRGKGRLTDDDVDEVLKEIRTALLEADVNVGVVRNVTARIREQAVGAQLSQALDPSQQIIKIVNNELTAMLGGETLKITYASRPPTVVLMAGLQGSGKTTNSAKLARWFKSQGRQPLMVGADLQRPAAVEQLRTLGRQIDVPVFSEPGDPVSTAKRGLEEARRLGRDVLIVDTAGRSGDRRRDDGAGPPDQQGGATRLHLPGDRRDDRSGRGQRCRGVPRRRSRSTASSCRSSTATPAVVRRSA